MLELLRHRGPDDVGLETSETALLGQTRLSVIDLETGHQPIVSEDGHVWLVCNGEIYNHAELRQRLERAGCRFRTRSDSEVILHLYRLNGRECVRYLRGMFAFAIWDEKARTLFAARDHLGQKPFYYHVANGRLLFASEIKALLAAEPDLAELDHTALDQYLALRLIAPPRSMFQNIRKLPPGHHLTYQSERGLEIERYWQPRYEPKYESSEAELLDELEEVLTDACEAHMVSDVPVGAFLSGGMDSSLLVALLAGRLGRKDLPTFTMSLSHESFDESPYARIVADRFGTDHHEETVTPTLVGTLPSIIWHLDEPSDPLSLPTFHLAQMAARHVKVVLGGDGGDEAFGGYDRYYASRYADRYARIPRPIRSGVIGPVLARLPDGHWYKSLTHQWKWLHRASFLEGADRYADNLTYFQFARGTRDLLYTAETSAAIDGVAEDVVCAAYDAADATESLDRMLAADVSIRLPDHPVMVTDRMTMAHGLEARSPYMDLRVVEFAARLPIHMKVRGRTLRYLQRKLALRHLPRRIIDRPKQGFSSALPYMLRDEYSLLYSLFLARSRLASDGVLRQEGIDHIMRAHESGRVDHGQRMWLLLNSEVWYRMLIQGESRADVEAQIADATRAATTRPVTTRPGIADQSAGSTTETPSGTA